MNVRSLVLKVHGYVGIAMGLLLMVISLSGAGIVFHEEMDHVLNRSLWHVTPQAEQVSPDAMLTALQTAHPGLAVSYIQAPERPQKATCLITRHRAIDGCKPQD